MLLEVDFTIYQHSKVFDCRFSSDNVVPYSDVSGRYLAMNRDKYRLYFVLYLHFSATPLLLCLL